MVGAIRANGWRQGAVFSADAHESLRPYADCDLRADDCCIAISQSCDLLCDDMDSEPIVEVVLARKLNGELDGNYTHAKNARRLHIEIDTNDSRDAYELEVRHRFSIPRSMLCQHSPDLSRRLDSASLTTIVHWIVGRYQRQAFPDAFNERTAKAIDRKIKPILRKLPRLTALYVALKSWDELPANETYIIELVGTVRREDFADPTIRRQIEQGLAKIAQSLNDCDGIEVEDSEVRSEAKITLDEVRLLARWHFDHISLRDAEAHEMPPTL